MVKPINSTIDFFDQRREWSRWKHGINKRYLPKFTGNLNKRYPYVYYVDAFAGAGQYKEKGTPPVDGSPLIAARIAERMATELTRSYDLRCINVEPDPDCFAELCKTLGEYQPPRVNNLPGKFRDNLDQILQVLGIYPALFFLDPFGYKGMEWDVIKRLADRAKSAKTELILRLDVPKIDRDAGWIDSTYQSAADAFVQALTEMFGTDAWQDIARSTYPQVRRFVSFKDLYVAGLRTAFGYAEAYPVRTIDGQLKYYIVQATTHPKGQREMSDVIFRVDHDYEEAKELTKKANQAASPQISFLDVIDPPLTNPENQIAETIARLADDIASLGTREQQMRFGRVQDVLVGKWFGQATESYYRRACKLLIKRGEIVRDRETGIEEDTVLVFRVNKPQLG